ncbi:MAG: hypothetical protein JWM77_3894 [Rhodospirillales bacterium]|nr:hypothetical protein [Rhodospirillales bacterium]
MSDAPDRAGVKLGSVYRPRQEEMAARTGLPVPPRTRLRWSRAHRIIPSRFPPIDLFERIADPNDWELLARLETRTNPRAREAWGEIALVPPERRVAGPGASWVMAPFCHVNAAGSRFGDGTFGVYYAAKDLVTAVAETAFHLGRFFAATREAATRATMRVLVGKLDATLEDLRGIAYGPLFDPDDWRPGQGFGRVRRAGGTDGFVYPSVRRAGGDCVALFWPDVPGIPTQERHLVYEWNGSHVARWFDPQDETWHSL